MSIASGTSRPPRAIGIVRVSQLNGQDGAADIVVASYVDRLVRPLRVQDQLASRVETAGGQVPALDTRLRG